MKRVRAGEGSYQQFVREIVETYFKQEKQAHKKSAREDWAEAAYLALDERIRRLEYSTNGELPQ
jgi:hypothetical protein